MLAPVRARRPGESAAIGCCGSTAAASPPAGPAAPAGRPGGCGLPAARRRSRWTGPVARAGRHLPRSWTATARSRTGRRPGTVAPVSRTPASAARRARARCWPSPPPWSGWPPSGRSWPPRRWCCCAGSPGLTDRSVTSLVVRRYASGHRAATYRWRLPPSPWHLVSAARGDPGRAAAARRRGRRVHVLRGTRRRQHSPAAAPARRVGAPGRRGPDGHPHRMVGARRCLLAAGGAQPRPGDGARSVRQRDRRHGAASWPQQGWASGPGCGPACPPGGRGHRRSCRSPGCATADLSATFRAPIRVTVGSMDMPRPWARGRRPRRPPGRPRLVGQGGARTLGRARPVVWRGEQPTEPMPLVESLRHTPYRDPNQLELTGCGRPRPARAIDLAVRAGELLLRCGAGAPRRRVQRHRGRRGLRPGQPRGRHHQPVAAGAVPHARRARLMTVLRVVRSSSRDFARLVAVHRFVEDLAAGRVDLDEATARLRADPAAEAPLAALVRVPGLRGLAASVAMLLGAGADRDPARRWCRPLIVDRVGLVLGRVGCPASTCRPSAPASRRCSRGCAFALGRSGWLGVDAQDFAYVVAGGIVVLLPGPGDGLLGRGRDHRLPGHRRGPALRGPAHRGRHHRRRRGRPVPDAAGRPRSSTSGSPPHDASSFAGHRRVHCGPRGRRCRSVRPPARSPCAAGARLVLPSAALGGLGVLCVDLVARRGRARAASAPSPWPASRSASAAASLALRLGAPGLVLIVPAVAPLLPGLKIFRGMYALVSGRSSVWRAQASRPRPRAGVTTLLGASAAALAIATGAVLGETMASPARPRDHPSARSRRR